MVTRNNNLFFFLKSLKLLYKETSQKISDVERKIEELNSEHNIIEIDDEGEPEECPSVLEKGMICTPSPVDDSPYECNISSIIYFIVRSRILT